MLASLEPLVKGNLGLSSPNPLDQNPFLSSSVVRKLPIDFVDKQTTSTGVALSSKMPAQH